MSPETEDKLLILAFAIVTTGPVIFMYFKFRLYAKDPFADPKPKKKPQQRQEQNIN